MDSRDRTGAVWAHGGPQINATKLRWAAGHVVAEHVNDEREVLVVCFEGSGEVVIDDDARPLGPGIAVVVPKGARRTLRAGTEGIGYVTAHAARGPLQVTRRSSPPQ